MQEAAANAIQKPKYMHKIVRGFPAGRGPSSVNSPKNYNQKLTNFIEESLFESEDRPHRFPLLVETYFQENLLKRFNLIKYLKAEIRREKQKNYVKRKIMEEQKSKTEQRNLSKTLVNNFKECIDTVLKEKQSRMESVTHGQHVPVTRSSLKEVEKRRILENFVENDEALG